MRINKYIASAGIASRRKADELIQQGKVRVNGAVLKEPGYDVQEGDEVVVAGQTISGGEKHVYYALNKPVGFITSTSDEQGRETVLDLMTDVHSRVFPVGRLDYMTSGLLLMTNDGELSNHIMHPSKYVWKTYIADIDGAISHSEVGALEKGVDIGGYITAPAKVKVLKQTAHASTVEVRIHEGKNRQVRKMFKAVGYNVINLRREAIGEIHLGRLLEGHYRKLTAQEIDYLKQL